MFKPLPEGVGEAWPTRPAEDVAVLIDDTWVDQAAADSQGEPRRHFDQAIFDEFFRLIDQAEKLVVMDMFLFNDMAGATTDTLRPLSGQLTDALIERKQARPDLRAVLITEKAISSTMESRALLITAKVMGSMSKSELGIGLLMAC